MLILASHLLHLWLDKENVVKLRLFLKSDSPQCTHVLIVLSGTGLYGWWLCFQVVEVDDAVPVLILPDVEVDEQEEDDEQVFYCLTPLWVQPAEFSSFYKPLKQEFSRHKNQKSLLYFKLVYKKQGSYGLNFVLSLIKKYIFQKLPALLLYILVHIWFTRGC